MVAGDGESKQVADDGNGVDGVLGSGGRVIDGSGSVGLMGVGFAIEVFLPIGGELPQIMPQPGEVAPLFGGIAVGAGWEHFGGESGCEVGDLVEVSVLGGEVLAVLAGCGVAAGAGGGGITTGTVVPRGEEGFPVVGRTVWQGVGVRVRGHAG